LLSRVAGEGDKIFSDAARRSGFSRVKGQIIDFGSASMGNCGNRRLAIIWQRRALRFFVGIHKINLSTESTVFKAGPS